jgi:hypothetical protein
LQFYISAVSSATLLTHRCAMVCRQVLEDTDRFPCTPSEGVYNAWVLKPAGKSRGRNIRVFNSLAAIKHHLQTQSVVEDCEFKPVRSGIPDRAMLHSAVL